VDRCPLAGQKACKFVGIIAEHIHAAVGELLREPARPERFLVPLPSSYGISNPGRGRKRYPIQQLAEFASVAL
jgi:hypothetical protein